MAAALEEGMSGRRGSGHQVLAYALLASLALHAMLLLELPRLRISAPPITLHSVALSAYLAQARAAPAMISRAAPPPPPLAPREPQRALERRQADARVPRSAARARELTQVRSASAPATRRGEQAASAVPAAAPAHPAALALAPRAAAPLASKDTGQGRPVAPRAAAAGDQALALVRYRLALIAQAKRYRRYPRLALDNNWRGEVDVRMVVGATGTLASLSVGRGSGHEVLDRQALDMIRKAKPLAPIPAALRGREFTLDIPVIFAMREPSA